MQFTNHNSNRFMPTTDDVAQSLINDFWTIANKIDLALCRWQDAADNGYGYLFTLGDKTDAAIELLDDACFTVGQYAAKGWAWWQNGGKDKAAAKGWAVARGVALAVMLLACVVGFVVASAVKAAPVAYRWVSAVGTPAVVKGLDRTVAFVLCYEEPAVVESGVQPAESVSPDTDWAFSKFGRLVGPMPSTASLVAWAATLR